MPRIRIVIAESTYFITSVTHQRRKWFVNPELAQIVVDQWKHYATAYEFTLDTYCVMPDHYHLLLKELIENGITSFIRRCNTSISKHIKHPS